MHEELAKQLTEAFKLPVRTLDDESITPIEVISTGSLKIDRAFGVGGFPKRRITSLIGTESSGKTTLILQAAAEVTQRGGLVGLVDYEHALDKEYCEKLGIKLSNFMLAQPSYAEEGINLITEMIKSGKFELIGLDSLASMVPKTELETGSVQMGLHARLMSQFFRNMRPFLDKDGGPAFVLTNQIREKIGIVYGLNESYPGGHAEKFYADIRLMMRRTSTVVEVDGEAVSNEVNVKVIKNKLAAPFKKATISMVFGEGTNRFAELTEIASDIGIIKKSGSWYSYGEVKLGQGLKNASKLLEDNPELFEEIKSKI